jgi:hypothetical protein
MMKICGAVYTETWKSDMDGKQRKREVHCTLPPGHVPGHGRELDKDAVAEAVEAARVAKGADEAHPKGLVGDVLAMLCGGLVAPKTHGELLAETILGVALGTLSVDLGRTDEAILSSCKAILARIRSAAADPEIVRDVRAFPGRIK